MIRWRHALPTIALAAALSGCALTGGDEMDPDEARAVLAARPTTEQATATLTQLRDDVAAAVSTAAGGLDFQPSGRGSGSAGCGDPFNGLGGDTVGLESVVAEQNVDDTSWPAVLEAATTLATAAGFEQGVVMSDRPGNHAVRFVDANGAYLNVRTQVATVIGAVTACHLPG